LITAVDYVLDGLRRSRERIESLDAVRKPEMRLVVADLEVAEGRQIPFRSEGFDAVLASLLVSYLEEPEQLLKAVFELLRPGGRLVLSAPRRDADLSKLYADMMAELPPARVRELFGIDDERGFERIQRHYLNEAARLLTLEDSGRFHFRDGGELAAIARMTGFEVLESELGLGEPPQAVVLAARRP
jgi:SAM-dependent methyltransferase